MIRNNIWIVLYEPIYEINIGYIARCMKNFSLNRLYIINPITVIGATAFRYASNASDILESLIVLDSIEELLDESDFVVGTTGKIGGEKNIIRRAISPEEFAKNMDKINGVISIIFGREDRGLPNRILSKCDIIINIKASPEYPILNISHAAAIIFYEIFKHSKDERKVKKKKKYQLKILEETISTVLEKLDLSQRERKRIQLVFKRVLGRAFLRDDEIGILLRTFKEIKRKLYG